MKHTSKFLLFCEYQSSNFPCLILICTVLTALLCGCEQKVHVSGRIYVITAGEEVIGMPAVHILACDTISLRNECETCNNELRSTRGNYIKQLLAAKANNDASEIAKVKSDWNSVLRQHILHNVKYSGIATTDSTGNFVITLEENGPYIFVAEGERAVADKTEKYFWIKEVKFAKPGAYKIEVNNYDDVRQKALQRDLALLHLDDEGAKRWTEMENEKASDFYLLQEYFVYGLRTDLE
jgi:hypothetical protein